MVYEIKGRTRLQNKLSDMLRKVTKAKSVRVGFLEGATYPDGTPVAAVAAFQNFGTRHIPPRPFFSSMVTAKSPEWPQALGKALVANDFDAERSLGMMGEGIVGDLRQSIKDTNEPPLAPATVKRKGFEKPLIDSAHMFNSADYEVKT